MIKVSKYCFLVIFILLSVESFAQFESRKYVCKNTNGSTETLYTEYTFPNEGPPIEHIFYSSSVNPKKIELIIKLKNQPNFSYSVQFPNDPKIYYLSYNEDQSLICKNPDGSKQIFIEEIPEEDFSAYIYKSKDGSTETLYMCWRFAVGFLRVVEYSSSKNPVRQRLKLANNDKGYFVSFPNDTKLYRIDVSMLLNGTQNQIICISPDGSKQIFYGK